MYIPLVNSATTWETSLAFLLKTFFSLVKIKSLTQTRKEKLWRFWRTSKRHRDRPVYRLLQRSSHCSNACPITNPSTMSNQHRLLATPAKIIRSSSQQEVGDFNLYRNAKRGFKRANNTAPPIFFHPFNPAVAISSLLIAQIAFAAAMRLPHKTR